MDGWVSGWVGGWKGLPGKEDVDHEGERAHQTGNLHEVGLGELFFFVCLGGWVGL